MQVFDEPPVPLVAPRSRPVRKVREIAPPAPPTVSANKRRWLYDFGQTSSATSG